MRTRHRVTAFLAKLSLNYVARYESTDQRVIISPSEDLMSANSDWNRPLNSFVCQIIAGMTCLREERGGDLDPLVSGSATWWGSLFTLRSRIEISPLQGQTCGVCGVGWKSTRFNKLRDKIPLASRGVLYSLLRQIYKLSLEYYVCKYTVTPLS